VENKITNAEAQQTEHGVPQSAQTQSSHKLITILLVCLLIVQVIGLGSDLLGQNAQRARLAEKQARIAEIINENEKERIILETLMTSYEKAAYRSNLDRIAEQQLVASEYSIRALQILGKQNNAIIELLADQP
jgi:uncharacterized protein HemX